MPPTSQTARVSEPQKIETASPRPQPAPRTKPFTIKVLTNIPA
ncbi:MAG: hypothetical protein ACRD1P_07075 [Thermoanaerobaculia bacterium]